MKSLLICLLGHYYTDMKRMIPAKLSRNIDAEIRSFCAANSYLEAIRKDCKDASEAEKARLRRKEQKSRIPAHIPHNPGIKLAPCSKLKGK